MISWGLLLAAIATSFLLTVLIEKVCVRFELFDHPGLRKMQKKPIPRLGGIVFILVPALFNYFLEIKIPNYLLISLLVIFIGGFLDDLSFLKSALAKLCFQIPATAYFAMTVDLSFLKLPTTLELSFRIVIGLYLLFMVNATNLMDNINGLAAGIFMVWMIGLAYLANAGLESATYVPLVLICCASVFGFYLRNYPWGKIYMGDQGSQSLGFLLAALSILILPRSLSGVVSSFQFSILMLASLFLLSFLFLLDVATVVAIRVKEKRPIWHGDQSHISHQLIRRNISVSMTSALLTCFQAFLVAITIAILRHFTIY